MQCIGCCGVGFEVAAGGLSMIKVGNRVHVDFISESATKFSNNHFTGDGVIDRIEDGRVFG